MTEQRSAGLRFRQALEVEKPLQIIGTVNAYAAMMAKTGGLQGHLPFGCWCSQLLLWIA